MTDMVNHPPHYTSHPSGIECIDITRRCGFSMGNAVKYIWRAWDKGALNTDLDKARFYLRDNIAHGSAAHPPYNAGKLLLEAASYDANPDRSQLLYLIAHGQLDNVIRRIDVLIGEVRASEHD
ncbi:DUF3310 domain-containing protein [Mycolicibacter heraklionensis]|uniref:DUF3310 domain-containing protein n=1 Tax=Mycolicibacter heraklionensis TaxID=512402 RepID=UPI0009E3027F|nr:DUF3310 domain-containing protein [Mycolicibacter heraklionensis]